MTRKKVYLAADFGGGSGRVMAGFLDETAQFRLEEVYRFANVPLRDGGYLCWDFWALFDELKEGLRRAAARYGNVIRSLAVDTWGVDYGIIDASEGGNVDKRRLLALPVCYRDERTRGMQAKFFEKVSRAEHYALTGIQQIDINTLFQLLAETRVDILAHKNVSLATRHSSLVTCHLSPKILFTPDLFNYFLTGVVCNEYTIASTSELLDARSGEWSDVTLAQAGLSRELFGNIVHPGSILGTLRREIADETGLSGDVAVCAVGSHDTQSAVLAAPLEEGSAFLSSGTWSLLGVELPRPILSEEARLAGFSNEGGVGHRICFLQNIPGLYPLQRLMKEWEERGEAETYDRLLAEAAQASFDETAIFDVADPRFTNPESMETELVAFLRERGLSIEPTKAMLARMVIESLATKYTDAVKKLTAILEKDGFAPLQRINIIGGGSRNKLLNRLTAERTGLKVVAGPVEATAMGNILCQVMAAGEISDLTAARDVVRRTQI